MPPWADSCWNILQILPSSTMKPAEPGPEGKQVNSLMVGMPYSMALGTSSMTDCSTSPEMMAWRP